jgi:hydrogenase maturation protein HypF
VRGLQQALRLRGLDMLLSHEVPPGDGGLSLGQAWVARKHQI